MPNFKFVSSLSLLAALTAARADLSPLGIFNGRVGLSLDGVGSNENPVGNVQAHIPDGATVLAAYLYSAGTPYPWYPNSPATLADYNSSGITLGGNALTFNGLVGATSDRPELGQWLTGRADVTSLVDSLRVNGQENYNWSISEGALNDRIDGEVLAIVYEHPSLPEGSVVLLDGGQATGGESTSVLFSSPLGNTTHSAFVADMSLAISYSTGNLQSSEININGTRLSSAAGGYNDGGNFDGGLLTVGGIGDSNANPLDPFSKTSSLDDELYSLKPFLTEGDIGFTISTRTDSNDDNIFFMALHISALVEQVNESPSGPSFIATPETGNSASLLGLGLAALSYCAARRRKEIEARSCR